MFKYILLTAVLLLCYYGVTWEGVHYQVRANESQGLYVQKSGKKQLCITNPLGD